MLPFTVRLRTGVSVYRQLVYAVQKAVVSGQLLPGDRFPSVRNLSQELRINPNTAQKVVRRLVDQGLLEVQPGIGTIVGRLPEATPRGTLGAAGGRGRAGGGGGQEVVPDSETARSSCRGSVGTALGSRKSEEAGGGLT